jgi:hypothetical protein
LVGFDGDGIQVRGKALAQCEVEVGVHEVIFTARSKSLVLRNWGQIPIHSKNGPQAVGL